jgi:hypothetical protein
MSLSSFSGLPPTPPNTPIPELTEISVPTQERPPTRPKKKTIQTELPQEQLQWLTETAALVRSNSTTPVPPSERCYPQHLIAVAIELLKASSIEWSGVRSVQDIRKQLNL